jgi:beta-fructofuranosidase
MMRRPVARRAFLRGSTALIAMGLWRRRVYGYVASKDDDLSKTFNDPRRPQYHLLPSHNWINDPNGPIYLNGKYHMFFQYNPEAAIWGNMSWNHAISDDMIHWHNYPVAFSMTPGGPDEAGCFSGSTIVHEVGGKKRVYAIYTGVVRDKANETIRNEGLKESQCLAWSDDPLLQRWTKREKPVIPAPPSGLRVVGFRDPSVWKQDGVYFMILGSGIEKVGGCALLYRSTDLIEWTFMHQLAAGAWNGKATSNPVDDGEMWECPEIFALDGQHLLIFSTERKVFWQSGVLDPQSMIFTQKKSGLIDLGAFYAPKSQLDAGGSRVLWGWLPERRSQDEMIKAGWSGMISLPRILNLDEDGDLKMTFLPSLQTLHKQAIKTVKNDARTTVTVPQCTGEVLCKGRRDQDWEVHIELPTPKTLAVKYISGQHMFMLGDTSVVLQPHDLPSIHMFFDGSVLEVLLGSRAGMTERFYYEGQTAPNILVHSARRDAQMQAWSLSPISNNRLTTTQSNG